MPFLLMLLLFATTANAVEQNRIELFLKLVRANGCTMDDATASRILPANNFTKQEVSQIEKALSSKGMIDKTKFGQFALTKAACKG